MTPELRLYVRLLDELRAARMRRDDSTEGSILEELDDAWDGLSSEDRSRVAEHNWRALPQEYLRRQKNTPSETSDIKDKPPRNGNLKDAA